MLGSFMNTPRAMMISFALEFLASDTPSVCHVVAAPKSIDRRSLKTRSISPASCDSLPERVEGNVLGVQMLLNFQCVLENRFGVLVGLFPAVGR